MTTKAHGVPFFQVFDDNGLPLSGGLVYFYEAGTSTLKDTYADALAAAANTNPVVLDSAGRATVYFADGLYKVRVETSAGVLVKEVDPFDPQVIDVPAPTENLIANGGFEADVDGDGVPDNWTFTAYTGGTVDVDRYNASTNPTPDVFDGEASVRMVHPGGAGNGGGYADQSDYFEVPEGVDLDVAVAVKCSAVDVHVKVDVRWFTYAKAAHGTPETSIYDEAAANPTTWAVKRATVTPPSGARFAKVRLYGGVNDDVTAGTIRFDRVAVRSVQAEYVRSAEADAVSGILTFSATPTLANNISLLGLTVAGADKLLTKIGGDDTVYVGDATLPTILQGTTLKHGAATIYEAGGTDIPVTDGGTGASDAATARANLGVDYFSGGTDVAVADGGTGASTAAAARTNLGIGKQLRQGSNTITISPMPTASGYTEAAHGFTGTPDFYTAKFVCLSTDAGYAANDELDATAMIVQNASSGSATFGIVADTTNFRVIYQVVSAASFIVAMDKGTAAHALLDQSKWSLVLDAWQLGD